MSEFVLISTHYCEIKVSLIILILNQNLKYTNAKWLYNVPIDRPSCSNAEIRS